MSSYLDELEADLRAQGFVPSTPVNQGSIRPEDMDLKIILDMQNKLGIKYSDEQKAILQHRGNSVILACAGSGKALVNGTGVLTPRGYRPIEELKVGDIVYDHLGNEQYVLGVYPQGRKIVKLVRFNTGDEIKCCGDHLWTVEKLGDDHWEVKRTEDIQEELEKESTEYAVPYDLDIYNGSYEVVCSDSYMNLVSNNVILYNLLGELIRECEPNNIKLLNLYKQCMCSRSIKSLYNICLADSLLIAKSDKVRNELKKAYELFGMSTCYVDGIQHERAIVSIEDTNTFEEMTCIKVSGMCELFLTEHCIPTHNTTISTHLIAKRIRSGEIKDPNKLLYVTYSKAGATEMKLRMNKVMKQLGYNTNIDVRTLHSFFNKLLIEFGCDKKVLKESAKYKIIAEACREAGFIPKEDDVSLVINLLSYQINNLLGDEKTFECVHNDVEGLTLEQYVNIRKAFAKKKTEMNVMDFDDMQMQMYIWAVAWGKSPNPELKAYNQAVLNYCKTCYTDFYIDEAQDVGKIQFEILKAIVTDESNPNKLTANFTFIGDDDQAIYSWRGSDPSIIQCAGSHFNIKNLVLSTNYRCKSEIVDFATTGIKCNNTRYEKGMNAHQSGGSVKIRIVADSENNLYSMSKLAADQIEQWIKDGVRPDEIAVLSRNNKHLSVLSIMLLNNNIFYNGTEEMRATKGLDYSELSMLIDMCDPCWKSEIPSKLFWKFNRYIRKTVYNTISKFMSEAGLSIEDALWYICKKILKYKDQIPEDKTIRVGYEADAKMCHALNSVGLGNTNLQTLYKIYRALTIEDKATKFKTLIALYKVGMDQGNGSQDSKRATRTLMSYAISLVDTYDFDTMKDFFRIAEQFENGTMGVMGEKVTLTTVHSAKGREWKNVIMFACDNLSEPSFSRLKELRDSDKATPDNLNDYIDEERRLFYVGSTRAKENLVLMTSMQPSVFILDSLGLEVKNSDILAYASQGTYGNEFKEEINDKIISKDSKYSVNS